MRGSKIRHKKCIDMLGCIKSMTIKGQSIFCEVNDVGSRNETKVKAIYWQTFTNLKEVGKT